MAKTEPKSHTGFCPVPLLRGAGAALEFPRTLRHLYMDPTRSTGWAAVVGAALMLAFPAARRSPCRIGRSAERPSAGCRRRISAHQRADASAAGGDRFTATPKSRTSCATRSARFRRRKRSSRVKNWQPDRSAPGQRGGSRLSTRHERRLFQRRGFSASASTQIAGLAGGSSSDRCAHTFLNQRMARADETRGLLMRRLMSDEREAALRPCFRIGGNHK